MRRPLLYLHRQDTHLLIAQPTEILQRAQNRHHTYGSCQQCSWHDEERQVCAQHSMSVYAPRLWLSLHACHADSLDLNSRHSMQQHHLSSYTNSLRCVPPTTSSCLPEPPMAASTQFTFAPCSISCSSGVLAPPPSSAHPEPAGSAAVQSQSSTRLSLAPETSRWPLPSARKHLHGPLVVSLGKCWRAMLLMQGMTSAAAGPEPYVP